LSCKQCFRHDPASKRVIGDMSYDTFFKIIQQLKNVFDVSLIGLGESFLNKDLYKMIDLLGKKKIDVSLTTNGTVFDNQILDAINRVKKVQIQFSLDAANQNTYKHVRGVDCFETVINNIQKFMEMKDINVIVSLGLVVMRDNVNELTDFIMLAKRLGIRRVHFGDLNGSWLGNNRDELLIDTKENLERNIKNVYQLANENGIDLKYNRYSYIWKDQANLTKCWFLWEFPYITWDGYLCSCCNLPNPETHNFGNVLKIPFSQLWNSMAYRNFRKLLKEGCPHKLCQTCHLAQ
ncbi:MAG: radical SAM protein, partial [Thermodesulfobacteriota bacterium]|nr:radical SAM protein [Thermodesulfobacteriota bacterium]